MVALGQISSDWQRVGSKGLWLYLVRTLADGSGELWQRAPDGGPEGRRDRYVDIEAARAVAYRYLSP